MAFSSFTFILFFLPLTVVGYNALVSRGLQRPGQLWLLSASLAFYSWGKPLQIVWLLGSILVNHGLDRALDGTADARAKKRILVAGLVVNIVFLAALKYTGFLLRTLTPLLGPLPVFEMAFPLGVSFFTLQQIMYLVDRYEGLAAPNTLLEHATFVSLFATITSGPIARSKQIVPSLRDGAGARAENTTRGLVLFAVGLAKKVIIADSFGQLVFDRGSGAEAWISTVAYSFRIYFDFSGYSDMAIAAGLLMGLHIPENFSAPYRSRSIIEFWQRWHMTLSAFITTYLYTPLVRSTRKVTLARASLATLVSMTIAGLWHGPNWTFVAFGLWHGIGLVINQLWRKKIKRKLPSLAGWALTFLFVNIGFVLFRADSLSAALGTLRTMAFINTSQAGSIALKATLSTPGQTALVMLPVAVGVGTALFGRTARQLADDMQPRLGYALALVTLFLAALLFMNSSTAKEFIYRAF